MNKAQPPASRPASSHLPRTFSVTFRILGGLVACYALFLISLASPDVQRHLIFLHKARWPLFPKYNVPEAYGFGPSSVRNIQIQGKDGIDLGAWHIMSHGYRSTYDLCANLSSAIFDEALRDPGHRTMLYLHGNAGSRLAAKRLLLARLASSGELNMNVLAIDYRGFADSSKHISPTEEGLVDDARSAWDWLTEVKSVPASQIVVVGHSLGTGVATALVGDRLARESIQPRALILTAPFASIRSLLLTYRVAMIVPILQPLAYFPRLADYLTSHLQTQFDSLSVIQNVECPVMLAHALDDLSIVPTHSRTLFDRLLQGAPEDSVSSLALGAHATLRTFSRPELRLRQEDGRSPRVFHLESMCGGHNDVGHAETTLRVMKQVVEEGWAGAGAAS